MPVVDPAGGRRRPKQRRSQETVDVILEATAQVLTEDGYAKASTNRIAKRAGVSVGSIYQYFGGKDALIAALAERHTLEMIEAVGQLLLDLSDCPLEEVVHNAVEAMVAAHRVNPELHQVLTTQCPDVVELPSVQRLEEGFLALLHGIMADRREELREDLDQEIAAWVITRAGEALTHAVVRERSDWVQDPRFVQEVTNLLVRYIARPR